MAGYTQNINTFSDATPEQEDIARRRRMADLLQLQSTQPVEQQMAGGYVIPTSPMQGLAKALQAYGGARMGNEAMERQKAMIAEQRAQGNEDITNFIDASQGRAARPEQAPITVNDDEGNANPMVAASPAVAPDNRRALAIALQSQNPMVAGAGQSMLAQMLKSNDPYSLREGEIRYGPNGQIIAQNAKGPENKVVSPGQTVVSVPRAGGTAVPAFSLPEKVDVNKPFNADGTPNQAFQDYQIQLRREGKPAVTVNVPVTTEKKFGEAFANQVATSDVALRDTASKAPELAERANRVKEILKSGNPITGFGADFRLGFGKAAALAGVKSAEDAAANTETLAAGLAENTLDAIKGSGLGGGSGFSNADRDFLEKAKGGKVTLEAKTIDRLADLAHRAASQSALRWSTRAKQIPASAIEGTGIDVSPVNIPPLYGSKPAAANSGWAIVK